MIGQEMNRAAVTAALEACVLTDFEMEGLFRRSLLMASAHGDVDTVALMLQGGAAVDLPDEDGCTPLFLASMQGRTAVVDLLLENEASTELPARDGATPLLAASTSGHADVVAQLLAKGANCDHKDAFRSSSCV